jgi:FO synthase subunit 2
MADAFRTGITGPSGRMEYTHLPKTDQSYENALEKAKAGERLTVADGVELLTTGTDQPGIDQARKEAVLREADFRRAEVVGDEVTVIANITNNVTTACNTGCLFCNFKNSAQKFETGFSEDHGGFTKTPSESRSIVRDAVNRGIYEVCSVSGLHPALVLNDDHREILESSERDDVNYKSPSVYETDPGTYCEQIHAMSVGGSHVHSMTPEEAYHARRGTDWEYEAIYSRLKRAGLGSVPGTAAEILVDEVREVICPGKIDTNEWIAAMEAAASVGLPMTATIMYGHVENAKHRVQHLKEIRDLQDRTDNITEFVPLSFVYQRTPLAEYGVIDEGASTDEDELMIAVSRLFLDNIDHIQSSWVKYGDEQGLKMLNCGADDFMGTLLSEEITKRAGGKHGEFRSFQDFVDMITAIGRIPVERSTDYDQRRRIDPSQSPIGPMLGPRADGSPLIETTR